MRLSLAHLPRTARDLIDLIGVAATLRLVDARAGQMIAVPKRLRVKGEAAFEVLAGVIGEDAAAALCERYGGEYLTVPSCKRAVLAVRDAELQVRFDGLLAEGLTARAVANQLAATYGLDVTSVWRASKRAGARADDPAAILSAPQADLFA